MFKWDKLSWIAAGIFVTGIVLGAFNNSFLTLLIVAYLLRPTILAFGGGAKLADERQKTIQFQSGNITLTVIIVAMIIFSFIDESQGKPGDKYNDILILALATKGIIGLIMLKDYKVAGFRCGFFMGLMVALFMLFSAGGKPFGFLIASPAFAVMILSYIGLKKPMLVSIFLAVIGIVVGILRGFFFDGSHLPLQVNILTTLLISLPLLITAFFFYKGALADKSVILEIENS